MTLINLMMSLSAFDSAVDDPHYPNCINVEEPSYKYHYSVTPLTMHDGVAIVREINPSEVGQVDACGSMLGATLVPSTQSRMEKT